ncbi:hypothetical protein EMIT0P201_11707 [Pseudomonas chlororaphis]
MSSENRGSGTRTDALASAESTGFLNFCYWDTAIFALGRKQSGVTGRYRLWIQPGWQPCISFQAGFRRRRQAIEKRGNLPGAAQVQRRNLRAYGQAHRLDTRAVATVEIPHEVQEGQECPVELFRAACGKVRPGTVHQAAHDHPGETGEPRCIEPDDQVGTGQAKVEGAPGIVAFTHPGSRCDRCADPFAELLGVGFDPVGLPEQCVQVDHRQVPALAEGAGEGGFAAPGITQNYNPLHGNFLSRKKPAIVQVLDRQLKADGWDDGSTGMKLGLWVCFLKPRAGYCCPLPRAAIQLFERLGCDITPIHKPG